MVKIVNAIWVITKKESWNDKVNQLKSVIFGHSILKNKEKNDLFLKILVLIFWNHFNFRIACKNPKAQHCIWEKLAFNKILTTQEKLKRAELGMNWTLLNL